jgi:hypothetical protein
LFYTSAWFYPVVPQCMPARISNPWTTTSSAVIPSVQFPEMSPPPNTPMIIGLCLRRTSWMNTSRNFPCPVRSPIWIQQSSMMYRKVRHLPPLSPPTGTGHLVSSQNTATIFWPPARPEPDTPTRGGGEDSGVIVALSCIQFVSTKPGCQSGVPPWTASAHFKSTDNHVVCGQSLRPVDRKVRPLLHFSIARTATEKLLIVVFVQP